MAPTGYSLTVRIDVTRMRKTLREAQFKFFPAYLWLVTRTLNQQTEFKIAEKDGQVGYYNTLTPLYAAFHPDDCTFSFLWTEYDDDFRSFHREYLENQSRFGANHGLLAQNHTVPPENAYTVSCLPWISFDSFSVHSYGTSSYYFPSVEAGKFIEQDGKTFLPLSITCHHAAADGWHVKTFLETFQSDADAFSRFL